jgi:hypothetical protein
LNNLTDNFVKHFDDGENGEKIVTLAMANFESFVDEWRLEMTPPLPVIVHTRDTVKCSQSPQASFLNALGAK